MRIIALIDQPDVIEKILPHLGSMALSLLCPSQQGCGLAVMGGHRTTLAAPSRQEDREGNALFQVQITPPKSTRTAMPNNEGQVARKQVRIWLRGACVFRCSVRGFASTVRCKYAK